MRLFSQTNQVFKSNPVFIDILEFEFHPVRLRLFYKDQLNFDEVKKSLLRFSASKCSYYVLFSMKDSYLLTAKITRNNYLALIIHCKF